MKKAILILIAGLLWCNVGFAGCIEGDCNNGYGTVTGDGNKYVGEFKDGKFNGQGILTYADGEKYVGEYKDGKRHGQGTYMYVSGNKYVGEWKNNERNGQGTYTFADGKITSGIWEKGKFVKRKKLSKAEAKEDEGIAKAQSVCRKVGFTPGTDKFLDCTIKMLTGAQSQGGSQTVIIGQRKSGNIYPLHCRQMGGASAC